MAGFRVTHPEDIAKAMLAALPYVAGAEYEEIRAANLAWTTKYRNMSGEVARLQNMLLRARNRIDFLCVAADQRSYGDICLMDEITLAIAPVSNSTTGLVELLPTPENGNPVDGNLPLKTC